MRESGGSARAITVAAVLIVAAAASAGGACGGTTRMGGFPERDARATLQAEAVDGCAVRTGRLVIETEEVLVREYPHYGAEAGRRLEEPMIVTMLLAPGSTPPAAPPAATGAGAGVGVKPGSGDDERGGELAVHQAPAAFGPGQRVITLERIRLLDQPLAVLRGRRLRVRLAENDRTKVPHWAALGATATKASAAVSVVGLPSPGGLLGEALEVLRQLDKDDLILIADIDLDAVAALVRRGPEARPATPEPAAPLQPVAAPAARLRFATSRRVAAGPSGGQPSAEMTLLAHREPEPGCP